MAFNSSGVVADTTSGGGLRSGCAFGLKKPVTYVSLAGEDHWLSQSATRTQMLKELDDFLSANLRKE